MFKRIREIEAELKREAEVMQKVLTTYFLADSTKDKVVEPEEIDNSEYAALRWQCAYWRESFYKKELEYDKLDRRALLLEREIKALRDKLYLEPFKESRIASIKKETMNDEKNK